MRAINDKDIDQDEYCLPLEQGGTGAMSLVEAASNLKLVTKDQIGKPGGPIALGPTGKIPGTSFPEIVGTNRVSLQGNFLVVTNETVEWTITDYDSFKDNKVSALLGTISLAGNKITYKAPANIGTEKVNVNGREISFAVLSSQPAKPSVTSPVVNAKNVSTSHQFTSSAFSYKGNADTHQASDWQIATDSSFANISKSVTGDTTNKTSWTPGGLTPYTLFYVRVRHRGASGNYGQWSDPSYFTTGAPDLSGVEDGILSSPIANATRFGARVGISDDGKRIVVGMTGSQSTAYVFLLTEQGWTIEGTLVSSPALSSTAQGIVAISGDGTRAAMGLYGYTNTNTADGKVTVFVRNGNTWTTESTIAPASSTQNNFGVSLSLNTDGTRMAVGASGGSTVPGRVYIFRRDNTTWTQEFLASPSGDARLGNSVAITGDGTRVVAGAPYFSNTYTNQGYAAIYVRNGTTWTLEVTLYEPVQNTEAAFGRCVSINFDGSMAVVGADYSGNGGGLRGRAHVYKRSGTTWALDGTIPDPSTDIGFATSVNMSSSGGKIIVGSPNARVGSDPSGKAHVYSRGATAWEKKSDLIPSTVVASALFGLDVAISADGTRAAVSSPLSTNGSTQKPGRVYTYR